MATYHALVRREFVLLPDAVLILTDELDFGAFISLELNACDSEHCRLDLYLSHHLILWNSVLNRQGIRTKLRSGSVVEDESQTVNSKTDVTLHLFQHSPAQLISLDFFRVGILEEGAFLETTN